MYTDYIPAYKKDDENKGKKKEVVSLSITSRNKAR